MLHYSESCSEWITASVQVTNSLIFPWDDWISQLYLVVNMLLTLQLIGFANFHFNNLLFMLYRQLSDVATKWSTKEATENSTRLKTACIFCCITYHSKDANQRGRWNGHNAYSNVIILFTSNIVKTCVVGQVSGACRRIYVQTTVL